ncbi:neural proliferation differentiation and control protein 1 [Battus philenor]|uniref:neural proliferation differentiation and control protein 1 n=1 Tax=Battus philenor TaxID=42288 RepID=UPI0035CFE61E
MMLANSVVLHKEFSKITFFNKAEIAISMLSKANKEYRLPVSLIPANLGWLKITHTSVEPNTEKSNKNIKPKPNVFYPSTPDPEKALHGIILITVFAASSTIVVGALVYGWYIFIRQGPPSVDVEYPNYGVTGPTADAPGDRRLARSAQMYHYQHQKQQIIAMEQNGMETRDGSVSDPDSEEENAEGEYTVYECPGLATTGEMEVKNPMFKEDPAPATPGTCELVHPQPKE